VPRKASRKTAGKTPDIRTVAAVAKVSIATVSRTINGSPLVSERLSKRVWQAIRQLNYFPNTHARTLVSGRSRLLGIIVENITNPFFPDLIQSFEEIAVANGYEILVSSSNSDPIILTQCVRRMLERKVEGVAVMTFGEEEPVLDQLVHRNVPIVLAEFKVWNCPRISPPPGTCLRPETPSWGFRWEVRRRWCWPRIILRSSSTPDPFRASSISRRTLGRSVSQ